MWLLTNPRQYFGLQHKLYCTSDRVVIHIRPFDKYNSFRSLAFVVNLSDDIDFREAPYVATSLKVSIPNLISFDGQVVQLTVGGVNGRHGVRVQTRAKTECRRVWGPATIRYQPMAVSFAAKEIWSKHAVVKATVLLVCKLFAYCLSITKTARLFIHFCETTALNVLLLQAHLRIQMWSIRFITVHAVDSIRLWQMTVGPTACATSAVFSVTSDHKT